MYSIVIVYPFVKSNDFCFIVTIRAITTIYSVQDKQSPILSKNYQNYTIGTCLSSGYKNTAFELLENDDLIMRVGSMSEEYRVLQFREDHLLSRYKMSVKSWRSQSDPNSFVFSVLNKLVECEGFVSSRDIVPRSDIELESLFQAKSTTIPDAVFGISGTVSRFIIPLGPSDLSTSNISLVVDYNVKLDGDLHSMSSTRTEFELLYLIYGYYCDQLSFFRRTGTFHIDGHAGNILYGFAQDKIYFVWSDFGRTSTSKGEQQFRNSLISFHNTVIKLAERNGYLRVQNILTSLARMSNDYSEDYINKVVNFEQMLLSITNDIQVLYPRNELEVILKLLSPGTSFGISNLSDRVTKLEQLNAKLEVDLKQLNAKFDKLSSQYDELFAMFKLTMDELNLCRKSHSTL